jgi:hypothetical protein
MGALLGPAHPMMGTYDRFLRKYSRMLTRIEFEIDHVHGRRLGPSIMTFHVQLAWWNWLVVQLDSGETKSISPLDFGAGLSMLETQNNLMWLPSVTNVPLFLSLSLGHPHASTCGSKSTSGSTHPSRSSSTRCYPIRGGSRELLSPAAQSGTWDAMLCSPRTPRFLGTSGPVVLARLFF